MNDVGINADYPNFKCRNRSTHALQAVINGLRRALWRVRDWRENVLAGISDCAVVSHFFKHRLQQRQAIFDREMFLNLVVRDNSCHRLTVTQ